MRALGDIGLGNAERAHADSVGERLLSLAAGKKADGRAFSDKDKADLRKQAQNFESLFVKQMIDAMRKTIDESDLFGDPNSSSKTVYRSMLDAEYAKILAGAQGFGLSDLVLEHFGVKQESIRSPSSMSGMLMDINTVPRRLATDFLPPAVGDVSSPFGMRIHPIYGELGMHDGIDLAMPVGTSVHASQTGRVVFTGDKIGYGKAVIIEHENGIQTVYAHLDEINVNEGDLVGRGKVIALSGNTGRSTGPHLHFEIRTGGNPVNPEDFCDFR